MQTEEHSHPTEGKIPHCSPAAATCLLPVQNAIVPFWIINGKVVVWESAPHTPLLPPSSTALLSALSPTPTVPGTGAIPAVCLWVTRRGAGLGN